MGLADRFIEWGVSPLINLLILGFLAAVIIRGFWRYELLRMETEALIRRYMVFRGKRHTSLSKVRARSETNKKILKSIFKIIKDFFN